MDTQKKAKNLPTSPGVYLMKDAQNTIIYVGKSKSLKQRVLSYFQNSKNHSSKVKNLVQNLKDFEYILTDTEFEALLLECQLIKQLQPRYNKKMKNPLSYTYISIPKKDSYPIIKIVNTPSENEYDITFGPYTSKSTVEKAVEGIKEYCKIPCTNPSRKSSTCLQYSLGLCIGICQGGSMFNQYNNIIHRVISLLNKTDISLLEEMKQKMLSLSEQFNFEGALKYRNYIQATESLLNTEKVITFTRTNKNMLLAEPLNNNMIKLFFIHGTQVLFSEKYNLDTINIDQLLSSIKTNILTYFCSLSEQLPVTISKHELDEAHIIYSYLNNNNCNHIAITNELLESKTSCHIDQILTQLIYGIQQNELSYCIKRSR